MGTLEIHPLDHEQLVSDASRMRALFDGAIALLTGDCKPTSVTTARSVMLEARWLVSTFVEQLEGLAARKAEAERAEQLHREAQAKITASSVAVQR